MEHDWYKHLVKARAAILADGYAMLKALTSEGAVVRRWALNELAGHGWRELDFLEHYFQLLMVENRRV